MHVQKSLCTQKKLHVFLSEQDSNFVYRRRLSSHEIQNVLMNHKQRCEQQKIRVNKTSKETHIHRRNYFERNPLFLRIYVAFEANKEVDDSVKAI